MHVLSVNVGTPQALDIAGKPETTGIHKSGQSGRVRVTSLGLVGDFVADVEHHGGPDQAVYVYTRDDLAWWSERLGVELAPGTFGENLTVAGLDASRVRIGDRLRVGTALLEVTAPRIPCATLAARMNDLAFVRKFREGGRPGFYTRVIEEGDVAGGDAASFEPGAGAHPTVNELYDVWFEKTPDEALLRRILAAPVAARARPWYEEQLAGVVASGARVATN
ncbi:MOSC domain-containing protein [Deinococcus pimensis]|uniref:MOSC domain-containing protein n=1 Tax=Deinococcus pimensis TaxID=309888 RepID=UPI00048691D5|nr:MOSC domain-containing protein [Deinococcus pimensis]